MTQVGESSGRVQAVVATAAALVLYALLLDGLIEAWVRGSEMRWIATAVVLLYGALSYGLWAHSTWRQRAAFSAALLLGLIGASAWLLGSVSAPGGFSLLGQTALLGALALLLALGLGAWIVWRLPIRDRRIRIALWVLLAYAVVPVAVGLVRGVPLEGMLRGEGFWEWPPFWLQGAYLGAAVLAPAAFAGALGLLSYELARGRVRGATALVFQSLALLLACLIATPSLQQQGLPNLASAVGLGSRRVIAASSPDLREERIAQADRLFDVLATARSEIPRTSFDVEAVVAEVGSDPEDLFEWVRDQTYLVPYRGALRGSAGVLMDRVGNGLDRALLLGELLRVAGASVRLVRAELDAGEAENLLEDARRIPEGGVPALAREERAIDEILLARAEDAGLETDAVEDWLEAGAKAASRMRREARKRADRQTERIAGELDREGVDASARRAAWVEALREHWWIQWQKDGVWTDLDPSRPGADVGDRIREGAAVAAASASQALEELLDARHHHQVRIRLLIEQWVDGAGSEREVASYTLRPSQCLGESLLLQHVPTRFVQPVELPAEAGFAERLRLLAVSQDEWVPVLLVGQQEIVGSAFGDKGSQLSSGGGLLSSPFERAMSQIETAGTDAALTAEWIEFEIRSPAREPRTIRRQVFDLLGPAARAAGQRFELRPETRLERSLTLLSPLEILPLVSALSQGFVEDRQVGAALASREAMIELGRQGGLSASARGAEAARNLARLPSMLFDFAVARHAWSEARSAVYLDRPNIVALHSRVRIDDEARIYAESAFDVIANEVAVRPGAGLDPFEARLAQGIIDTNVEAVLLGGRAADNAGELMARRGGGWAVARSAAELADLGVELPADARVRIERELEAGYAVMLPEEPVDLDGRESLAWWRIDPATGDTLGMGPRGWGKAASDYGINVGSTLARTRGEGLIEYIIIIGLITVCLWVGLGSSISDYVHGIASDFRICIEGGGSSDEELPPLSDLPSQSGESEDDDQDGG